VGKKAGDGMRRLLTVINMKKKSLYSPLCALSEPYLSPLKKEVL